VRNKDFNNFYLEAQLGKRNEDGGLRVVTEGSFIRLFYPFNNTEK